MISSRAKWFAGRSCGLLVAIAAVCTAAATVRAERGASSSPSADSQRALVDRYCMGCHNATAKTGGVSLQDVNFANVGEHAAILERVLHKVRSGEMQPSGRPGPDAASATAFTASLEHALDDASAAHPNPGHPAVHR